MATGFLIRITVILDIKDVGLPRWARAEKLLDDSPKESEEDRERCTED